MTELPVQAREVIIALTGGCNFFQQLRIAWDMVGMMLRRRWGLLRVRYLVRNTSVPKIWRELGPFHSPIILAANAAIAAGTYFGGWRIVHTMGSRITKLKPVGKFCAEFAGAITLFSTALAGIPVSTTHTITGALVGVGATTRLSAVRWGVARRIVWAWILTIPASAVMAALTFKLFQLLRIAG
jgi:PiT family inorganic phosphate transporter